MKKHKWLIITVIIAFIGTTAIYIFADPTSIKGYIILTIIIIITFLGMGVALKKHIDTL